MQNLKTHSAALPAVDLTTCDLEQIHLIGAVQSFGFLLALSRDWRVACVSANAVGHLHRPVDQLVGASLDTLISPLAVHAIRNRLSSVHGDDAVERAFAVQLQDFGPLYDLAVHLAGETIIIEAERSEPTGELNAGQMVRSMIARMQGRASLTDLVREAARLVQALTGFDRVMIYKFLHDQSGEVIAERARSGLEPYLGLRYPASDIPLQARALLIRSPVRVLVDVAAEPSPLISGAAADSEPLDLSMSTLRAHSMMHVEYLRNMGVRSTMTVSLVRNGELWGLISCHHMTPRHVGLERRTTAELFAHIFTMLLDRAEYEEGTVYEQRTRQLHNQLLAAVAEGGSAGEGIARLIDVIAQLVPCDGVAICIDGKVTLRGTTPTHTEFTALRKFLDTRAVTEVYAIEELGQAFPPARDYVERAAGMLVIPVSRSPRDYLVFFRHEIARSVVWAGEPVKQAAPGPDGVRLSPRKSFAAWREIKRGTSAPWTHAERRAADALRVTLLEVVLRLISVSEAERQAATQKQELLIAELNHRVRNILGLIRGLIAQSRTSTADVDTFATVLGERVHALARAHDQITAKSWGPGSLATLIATEASAYLSNNANRIRAHGDAILLQPQAFSTVALVIHELMTNAAKYGSLTDQHGQVVIEWRINASGDLVLDWHEVGGPVVQAPTRRGFGSMIIERSVPHELGGEASLDYLAMGLHARFVVPSRHLVLGEVPAFVPPPAVAPEPAARLSGVVLLVEDNMMIALDAEEMLLSLGAERILLASNVADALELLQRETPSFALLDVNLGSETSFRVAQQLHLMGVPHIFATGYGNGVDYPVEHRMTPAISKPYTAALIAAAFGHGSYGGQMAASS